MSPKPVSPVVRWAVYIATLAMAILIGLGLAALALAQPVAPPPGQCIPVDYPPGLFCTPDVQLPPPDPGPRPVRGPPPAPEEIPALGPIALLLLAGAVAALPWVRRR